MKKMPSGNSIPFGAPGELRTVRRARTQSLRLLPKITTANKLKRGSTIDGKG
jgi:hypothetical protein